MKGREETAILTKMVAIEFHVLQSPSIMIPAWVSNNLVIVGRGKRKLLMPKSMKHVLTVEKYT